MPRPRIIVTFEIVLDMCKRKWWLFMDDEFKSVKHYMKWKCSECGFVWVSNYKDAEKQSCSPRCCKGAYRVRREV